MLHLDEDSFEPNTIIDLVVPPGMPIGTVLAKLAADSRHLIILDTQGELYFEHSGERQHLLSRSAEMPFSSRAPTQRTDYCFTASLGDLFGKLRDIRQYSDFVLVIDSATFVCDRSPRSIRLFNAMLWSVVYACNATVITVNHYRIGRVGGASQLVPRMGGFWSCCVSYQLLFTYNGDGIEFSVSSQPVDGL